MSTPQQRTRKTIDQLVTDAGWCVQDRAALNLSAGHGVAVREAALRTGFADYLLFVDRKAIGAVEAKPEGTPLSGIEPQAEKYGAGLPDVPPAWRKPLPFLYESTGVETFFTNGLDPKPRSRRVFAFHRLETLGEWCWGVASNGGVLRNGYSALAVLRCSLGSCPVRKVLADLTSPWGWTSSIIARSAALQMPGS